MQSANQHELLARLRQKASADAASWLMEQYSFENGLSSQAIHLISHRSWKKEDQIRLAEYYLQNAPYAHSYPYEVFASIMGTKTLVGVLRRHVPADAARRDLMAYFVTPLLRSRVRSHSDEQMVWELLKQLSS